MENTNTNETINIEKYLIDDIHTNISNLVITNTGIKFFLRDNNIDEKLKNELLKKIDENSIYINSIQEKLLKVDGLNIQILDGLQIFSGKFSFLVPVEDIVETLVPKKESIKYIGDGTKTMLMLREEAIPIVKLSDFFNFNNNNTFENGVIIIVKNNNEKIGIFIDKFGEKNQIVIKNFDETLKHINGIKRAALNSDGSVGLVLEIKELFK